MDNGSRMATEPSQVFKYNPVLSGLSWKSTPDMLKSALCDSFNNFKHDFIVTAFVKYCFLELIINVHPPDLQTSCLYSTHFKVICRTACMYLFREKFHPNLLKHRLYGIEIVAVSIE